jgi:hypothetical protein
VVALIAILIGVFAVMPSATADHGHRHGRHIEHFLALGTDPNATSFALIAKGPIHAKGTDTPVSNNRDRFKFPRGTLSVEHHATKPGKSSTDATTCLSTFTEHGTYRVTGGTRAYEDARGHGRYTLRVLVVACDPKAAPEVFILKITASGPLHL